MKISDETLKMLKWMASVNGGIKIDPGNELYSKAESQAMACKCKIAETFDKPFVTTNLAKFLSLVELVDNPDFEFNDDSVIITSGDGKNKVRFLQSNPALVSPIRLLSIRATRYRKSSLTWPLSLPLHLKTFRRCSTQPRCCASPTLHSTPRKATST